MTFIAVFVSYLLIIRNMNKIEDSFLSLIIDSLSDNLNNFKKMYNFFPKFLILLSIILLTECYPVEDGVQVEVINTIHSINLSKHNSF